MTKCKGGCQMKAGGKTCAKCGCDMSPKKMAYGGETYKSGGSACMKCGGKMKGGGTVNTCMKCGGGKYTFGGKTGWMSKKKDNVSKYQYGGMTKRDKSSYALGGTVDTGCPPGMVKDPNTGECVYLYLTSDINDPKLQSYQDSADIYNFSKKVHRFYPDLPKISKEEYDEIEKKESFLDVWEFDKAQYEEDEKNNKDTYNLENYIYKRKYNDFEHPKFQKNYRDLNKYTIDNISDYSITLKDGNIKTPGLLYNGKPIWSKYNIYNPRTETKRYYDENILLGISNNNIKPESTTYYGLDKPVEFNSLNLEEYSNNNLTKNNKYKNYFYKRETVDNYKAPIIRVKYDPKAPVRVPKMSVEETAKTMEGIQNKREENERIAAYEKWIAENPLAKPEPRVNEEMEINPWKIINMPTKSPELMQRNEILPNINTGIKYQKESSESAYPMMMSNEEQGPVNKKSKRKYQYGGQATAQDSMDVYNRAVQLDNFYKNADYKLRSSGKFTGNILDKLNDDYNEYLNRINDPEHKSKKWKKVSLFEYDGNSDEPLDKYATEEDYRKTKNANKPNIIEQREKTSGALNMLAPFGYYDTRIQPQFEKTYVDNEIFPTDIAEIYTYDPVAVKPYSMRSPAEHEEFQRKYGTYKPKPVRVPIAKMREPDSTNNDPITELPIQKQQSPNNVEISDSIIKSIEEDILNQKRNYDFSTPQYTMKTIGMSPEDIQMLHEKRGLEPHSKSSNYSGNREYDLETKLKMIKSGNYNWKPIMQKVGGYTTQYGKRIPSYDFAPTQDEWQMMQDDPDYRKQWDRDVLLKNFGYKEKDFSKNWIKSRFGSKVGWFDKENKYQSGGYVKAQDGAEAKRITESVEKGAEKAVSSVNKMPDSSVKKMKSKKNAMGYDYYIDDEGFTVVNIPEEYMPYDKDGMYSEDKANKIEKTKLAEQSSAKSKKPNTIYGYPYYIDHHGFPVIDPSGKYTPNVDEANDNTELDYINNNKKSISAQGPANQYSYTKVEYNYPAGYGNQQGNAQQTETQERFKEGSSKFSLNKPKMSTELQKEKTQEKGTNNTLFNNLYDVGVGLYNWFNTPVKDSDKKIEYSKWEDPVQKYAYEAKGMSPLEIKREKPNKYVEKMKREDKETPMLDYLSKTFSPSSMLSGMQSGINDATTGLSNAIGMTGEFIKKYQDKNDTKEARRIEKIDNMMYMPLFEDKVAILNKQIQEKKQKEKDKAERPIMSYLSNKFSPSSMLGGFTTGLNNATTGLLDLSGMIGSFIEKNQNKETQNIKSKAGKASAMMLNKNVKTAEVKNDNISYPKITPTITQPSTTETPKKQTPKLSSKKKSNIFSTYEKNINEVNKINTKNNLNESYKNLSQEMNEKYYSINKNEAEKVRKEIFSKSSKGEGYNNKELYLNKMLDIVNRSSVRRGAPIGGYNELFEDNIASVRYNNTTNERIVQNVYPKEKVEKNLRVLNSAYNEVEKEYNKYYEEGKKKGIKGDALINYSYDKIKRKITNTFNKIKAEKDPRFKPL